MRCLLFTSLVLALTAATAAAQPAAPFEVFAGYSLLPADPIDDFPRATSHGVQVTAAANVTNWFAVVADVGYHRATNRDLGPNWEGYVAHTRVTELLAGPRFAARSNNASVFVHGLAGWIRGDAGPEFDGFSDTKIAFGGGAGVDVAVGRRLALRAQFDLLAAFADIVEGNSRFAIGIVTRLGG